VRTLPNGLPVHGATRADVRFQQGISDYFRPGVDLRPGMTVVDVGANIGLFSLEILRRCGGDARIVAIEPAPATFAHLERNLHELYPQADTRAYRCAVGDHQGETVFYHRPGTATMSSLYREPPSASEDDLDVFVEGFLREPPAEYRGIFAKWLRLLPRTPVKKVLKALFSRIDSTVVEVPCTITTLSAILHECGIDAVDFLKIDVEGAEADVLRGIGAEHWPKINELAVEVHDVDNRVKTTRELLESHGYGNIEVSQQWPFEGSNVHMVHASRAAVREPALNTAVSRSRST